MKQLWTAALTPKTSAVYNSGMKCYQRFAAMYGHGGYQSVFPSEEILMYFTCHCYGNMKLKYCTIKTYLAGIRHYFVSLGCDNPLINPVNGLELIRLKNLLRAIKRIQGVTKKPRLPLTFDLILRLCNMFDQSCFGHYTDKLMKATSCIAFFGFLRCGEFTCQKSFSSKENLCWGDLILSPECNKLILTIKVSKTDPFRQGIDIAIFKTGGRCCPVQAFLDYRSSRQHRFPIPKPSDPLFLTPTGKPLTRQWFLERLREALTKLGLNPSLYSGHSFRIGAATSAAKAQVNDHLIRVLGRWASDCYIRYIHTAPAQIQGAQLAMVKPICIKNNGSATTNKANSLG